MSVTDQTDDAGDERVAQLQSEYAKKMEELMSKHQTEVATLSVKLRTTKQECEQRWVNISS